MVLLFLCWLVPVRKIWKKTVAVDHPVAILSLVLWTCFFNSMYSLGSRVSLVLVVSQEFSRIQGTYKTYQKISMSLAVLVTTLAKGNSTFRDKDLKGSFTNSDALPCRQHERKSVHREWFRWGGKRQSLWPPSSAFSSQELNTDVRNPSSHSALSICLSQVYTVRMHYVKSQSLDGSSLSDPLHWICRKGKVKNNKKIIKNG